MVTTSGPAVAGWSSQHDQGAVGQLEFRDNLDNRTQELRIREVVRFQRDRISLDMKFSSRGTSLFFFLLFLIVQSPGGTFKFSSRNL